MELFKEDIKEIGFEKDTIFLITNDGKKQAMPLRWFPSLNNANEDERNNYTLSSYGIHWENLNEDLSFSGFFTYDKDKIEKEKNEIQYILSQLPFINLDEFSRVLGVSPVLMRNYACGAKQPTEKQAQEIKAALHKIGAHLQAI